MLTTPPIPPSKYVMPREVFNGDAEWGEKKAEKVVRVAESDEDEDIKTF